jgi:hypothetical protein
LKPFIEGYVFFFKKKGKTKGAIIEGAFLVQLGTE